MAAKLGLVLDCADADKLAEFWSAAIGYTMLGGAGSCVLLVDDTGQQPKLLLQHVDEPKAGQEPHAPRHRDTHGRRGGRPPRSIGSSPSRGPALRARHNVGGDERPRG